MAVTKLKLALLVKGFTQREVSRRSGIHESVLSLIAQGRYLPDKRQKELIAKVLGENEKDLFSTFLCGEELDK